MEKEHIYKCKDGRVRCYNPISHSVTSYPRLLLERKLGRSLMPDEQVHHIDGDPSNNNLDNLAIVKVGEHQRMHARKYYDKKMICPYCGSEFVWTAKSQRNFMSNKSRKISRNKNPLWKPFCSKHCAGAYARREQLKGTQK